MVAQYYYRLNDVPQGPASFEDLVVLAIAGELQPETLVRFTEQKDWHPAGEVGGLFHKAGRAEDVSRWRAERRNGAGGRIQRLEEIKGQETGELGGEGSPELRREIKAATYEAALQWQSKHRQVPGVVAVERDSRLRAVMRSLASGVRRNLIRLLWLPFSLISAAWVRTGIDLTVPAWLERFLGLLFSHQMLIVAFRWGITLVVPNLVAWGIFSWSNVEAQRFPPRDQRQVPARIFPVWGTCSSEGEYMFLLVDTMLMAGVATYLGIRWLESKADD